jgi:serine/threonine protein kinase
MADNKEKKLSGSKNKNNNNKQKQKIQEIKLEHAFKSPSLSPIIPNQINFQLERSYTNPSPTNFNTSKLSAKNKNRINFETLDKNKITDQTLPDNVHAQLNMNSIEEERVSPSSFICLAQLGKGSFGEVYLVQKINTKEKFAMKVLRKERIMGQNLLKYAIAERNVLSLSNHPFIVKLNFAFQTSSKLFLILEYCCNGDLAKHLLFEKRFSESRAKFYICEVLLALENLHQRDIIFRDLKPDNVVLDAEGHCKLTDFGLSKEGVTENQSASSFCGSIAYLAPEMLKKQGHGKAVDWYLLGVLLYEMLVGITPFFTNRKEDIFHNIEFEELKIPEFIKEDTASLLKGLLQKDPWKRLGGSNRDAEEIKEHPYFKDVNWDDVYNKRITPPPFNIFSNNIMHVYQRPRLFNDDSMNRSPDKTNPNMLPGWSFINNDE